MESMTKYKVLLKQVIGYFKAGWVPSGVLKARFRKNVRPQCNATFMATVPSSYIVENWYSIFLKTVAKCNMSSFEKNEVRNAFLTLIFLWICHTFRTLFLNLALTVQEQCTPPKCLVITPLVSSGCNSFDIVSLWVCYQSSGWTDRRTDLIFGMVKVTGLRSKLF